MPMKTEELCNVRLAFEWPGGVLLGSRWLAGERLLWEPEDFVDALWSDVAAVLGGPLLDVPVLGLGLLVNGLPAPMCFFLRDHLPSDPGVADLMCSAYQWSGKQPVQPTWRQRRGDNGQG